MQAKPNYKSFDKLLRGGVLRSSLLLYGFCVANKINYTDIGEEMSFASEAKKEVMSSLCENECCKLAQFSAIIHSIGEIDLKSAEPKIFIKTETEAIYNIVNDTLKRLYGEFAEIELDKDMNISRRVRYVITIPQSCTRQVLFDCGLVKIGNNNNLEIIEGIEEHITESDCCALSYIKGVFLTSATTGIKIYENENNQRKFSGYHLEFVFNNETFATDFANLLFSQGVISKKSRRKHLIILYIKEAELVSDLLAMVGAYKSVLKLQNEIAMRTVRNNINRQTNCLSANMDKTINAAQKQLMAINKISKRVGIENIPESLQALCLVRLANPEESLENLAKLLGGEITKSGINHKMRKILKLSEEL